MKELLAYSGSFSMGMRMSVENSSMSMCMNMHEVSIQQEIPIAEYLFRWSLTSQCVLLIEDDTTV